MCDMQTSEIEALFDACDLNLSGYIEKDELETLCSDLELTDAEFDEIFSELDRDQDGKISKDDFKEGFRSISNLIMKKKCNSPTGSPLLRARTFNFDETEDKKMEEEEVCLSTASNTSCKSDVSTKSSKSITSTKSSCFGSGRNTPRKKTSQTAAASLENNKEKIEKLVAELDSEYYQLNRPR